MTTQQLLVIAMVALPAAAIPAVALPAWFGMRADERRINAIVAAAFGGATIAGILLVGAMIASDSHRVVVAMGNWFEVGPHHFPWTLIADRLSIPFALFSALLVGIIGAFSRRYMHRERGYRRFYLLLTVFGAGVQVVVLAGTLDILFFGWEVVGLASALLIAFFHERPKPIAHGLRAFATYRVCDIGLLIGAVWLHRSTGSAGMVVPAPADAGWAGMGGSLGVLEATSIGLLLLWAAIGKSAQLPFGGWLPRAMEGPTPSSAIFYGAISVHLGAYLLLRAAPLLDQAPLAALAVTLIGGATALHATFVGRVQSDIKSALAYASMTQVGLIFVEIGLGFRMLPLAHIVGHAAVRSLQILRSPSLLHDHHQLEQAMGRQLPKTGGHLERLVPTAIQPWLYRHALERGYFDAALTDFAVHYLFRGLRALDGADQAWTALISTAAPPSRDASPAHPQEAS